MPNPYQLNGVVYDTDGTTALSGVTVRVRNETTNKNISTATASDGSYVLNLANLDQGWTVGDVITVYVLYTQYEDYETFTIPNNEGGRTINLTVTTVSVGNLNLFTVQEFFDYFNMVPDTTDSQNGIKTKDVVRVGRGAELVIEDLCNTKFTTQTESDYIYVDGKGEFVTKYFLGKAPIISITALQTTQTNPGTTATWSSLTSGRENDYVLHSDIGMIEIVDEALIPPDYPAAIRWTGTWGHATVPQDIKTLAIVWTGIMLMGANATRARVADKGDLSVSDLDWFLDYKSSIISARRIILPYNT